MKVWHATILMGILAGCGGGGSSSPSSPSAGTTPTFSGSEVVVNVYEINDGFKTQVRVPVQSGRITLDPTALASAAGVSNADGHIALRSGRGVGTFIAEYTGTQSITATTGEVTAFLRPSGPRYNLMAAATLFNGRTYNFGFDSETKVVNGQTVPIVGPDDFWPRVFALLADAFRAKDGTVYATITFDKNVKGNYTAGFGNQSLGATGYQIVSRTNKTIRSYVLGSNSFAGSPDFENWTIVGTGVEEVLEPIVGIADIAGDNTSYTLLFSRANKFSDEGLALIRDALTRLP